MGKIARSYRHCKNCKESDGEGYHKKYCLPAFAKSLGIDYGELYEVLDDVHRGNYDDDWDRRKRESHAATIGIIEAIRAGCENMTQPLHAEIAALKDQLSESMEEIAKIRLALELKSLSESIK